MRSRTCRRCAIFLLLAAFVPTMAVAQDLGRTERLAALAKTWGFLKYYHDRVALGLIDWDRVLIDRLPAVKQAGTKEAFNHEILTLIRAAGYQKPGRYGQTPPKDADFSWMDDRRFFFPLTSALLNEVYWSHGCIPNYYTQFNPANGTISFLKENFYTGMTNPAEDYRLLALFRYWNVIRYFFPHRSVMDQDWNLVLEEILPTFLAAASARDYQLAIYELSARINDGHAATMGDEIGRFWGVNWAPLRARRLEGRAVVEKTFPALLQGVDVRAGDVITALDGRPIDDLRQEKRKYIPASNDDYLEYRLLRYLLRSNDAEMSLTLDRGGQTLNVRLSLASADAIDNEEVASWPRTTFSILPGNIGYVHMGLLDVVNVDATMHALRDTRAVIFDLRVFPNAVLYNICDALYPDQIQFAHQKIGDTCFPGQFYFTNSFAAGQDAETPDSYRGQVIILANEKTLSRGEFTTMAMRAVPGAVVIGSRTAGANGNVADLVLPGEIVVGYTGVSIFDVNHRSMQRIGVVPDIVVRPTVAGLRAGRDEELERALEYIDKGR